MLKEFLTDSIINKAFTSSRFTLVGAANVGGYLLASAVIVTMPLVGLGLAAGVLALDAWYIHSETKLKLAGKDNADPAIKGEE